MFGSGAQGTQHQGGFGSVQSRGFGQGASGTGGAGTVKWGGGGRSQAPSAQPAVPGGTIFGQPAQRPRSAPEAGRGRGRATGRGAQQGRGWQTSRAPPPGRGRGGFQQQQQQPQQPRSPGVLQRLGSLVGSPWGKGPQQQQQPNDAAARAAAAAAAALGGWTNDRGRGRSSGRQQGGRGQQQQTQQWGSRTGRDQQQPRNQTWTRGQQQQSLGGRGWGSGGNRGRGFGRDRGSSDRGSVFSRLGSLQDSKGTSAAGGYGEEEMTPVDEEAWEGDGGAAAADGGGDGWAGQQQDGWDGHEEEMADMDADFNADGYDDGEGYQDADGDEQQYEEEADDGTAANGDGEQDGVMTAEEIAAAEQAALAAMPKFIGGGASSSKAVSLKSSPLAFTAVTPPRPATSYFKMAGGGTPGTPTQYDLLQPSPSRPDVYKRLAAAAEGGLNINPQCNDMCPRAERDQRTADRQLHDFERVGTDYGTDAEHAVKKYTRSEAGGLPNTSFLRTFEALKKTLLHLRSLMSRVGDGTGGTCSLLEAHRFLWDRYRSIRKDITQTELMHKGDNQLRWVIAANEEMARFMILADAFLADKDKINYDVKKAKSGSAIEFDMDQFQADAEAAAEERAAAGIANFEPDPYDGHLNHQELSKTLLDLSALYREAHRLGVDCPHEAEFLAYYLIVSRGTFGSFKQSTANFVRLLNQMTPDVAGSSYIQFALELSGCLASTNYVGFIKLLTGAPLHLAAAGQIYVPRMRSIGLCCMLQSAALISRPVKQVPLELYTKLLGFDSSQQARDFALKHTSKCPDLTVHTDSNGEQMLEVPRNSLSNLVVLKEPPRHCLPWILDKGQAGLGELVSTACPLPGTRAVRLSAPVAGTAVLTLRPAATRQQIPKPATIMAQQQQQPLPAALQPRKATVAERPTAAGQSQPRIVQLGGAPGATAAVQGQGFGGLPVNARGSVDHLTALMAPSQAAAEATAVFGNLDGGKPAAGTAWGQPQAAAVVPSVDQQQQWTSVQQQRPTQPQHQQQHGGAGLPGLLPVQQQPYQRPQPLMQQQQQQQQQQMILQQQQQAVTAAVAAERARAKADKERLEAENKRLAAQLRLIQQAEELRDKCDWEARRLWLMLWQDAAKAAKQARLSRERRAAALEAADAAIGRLGNKRTLAVAGGDHSATGVIEWEMQLEKRVRCDMAAYEEALSDLSPRTQQVASVISTALHHAATVDGGAKQPALTSQADPLSLPRLAYNSSTTGEPVQFSLLGNGSNVRRPAQCAVVQPHYKLLLVSGWRETKDDLCPPLYQRRMANWLRHKLSNYTPSKGRTAEGSGDVIAPLVSVPVSADDQQPHQQQPRSYAAVVRGRPPSLQQQQHQLPHSTRYVMRYGGSRGEADQLVCMDTPVELVDIDHRQREQHQHHQQHQQRQQRGLPLNIEVVDVVSSKLSAGTPRSSTPPPACIAGACGILLLVSGPDEAELTAAVKRLVPLLEVLPAGDKSDRLPLAVLACSDPSTKDAVSERLQSLITALPGHLVSSKLTSADVFCAGPGSAPMEGVLAAVQYAARKAPQVPMLRQVAAADLLEALQALHLAAAAAYGASARRQGDVLCQYVTVHNRAVQDMRMILQQQLNSRAYQWGYPPGQSVDHTQRINGVLQTLEMLVLPEPPALQQQQQPNLNSTGSWPGTAAVSGNGESVLLQLRQYLQQLEQQQQEPVAEAAMAVYTWQRQQLSNIGKGLVVNGNSSQQQQQREEEQSPGGLASIAMLHLLEELRRRLPVTGVLLIDAAALQRIAEGHQQLLQQQQHDLECQQQQQQRVQQLQIGSQLALPAPHHHLATPSSQTAVSAAATSHQQHMQGHDMHLLRPLGTAGNAADAAAGLTPVAAMAWPVSTANGVLHGHTTRQAAAQTFPNGISSSAGTSQALGWLTGPHQAEQQALQTGTNTNISEAEKFIAEMGKIIPGPLSCLKEL